MFKYNPVNFVGLRDFQDAIDICKDIFPRFFEDVKKYPDYPLDGVYPLLKNCNKKLQKNCDSDDYQIHLTFPSYFDRLTRLNASLKGTLGFGIDNFEFIPSELRFGTTFFGVGPGFVYLKINPIYIIPKDKTTLIIIIIPDQPGLRVQLFQHFQKVFKFLEILY